MRHPRLKRWFGVLAAIIAGLLLPGAALAVTIPKAPAHAPSALEALSDYRQAVADAIGAQWLFAEQAKLDYSTVPKISAHEHYWAPGDLHVYRDLMDELGIRKVLFVPTGEAPDNWGWRENLAGLLDLERRYPDRIWTLATCDVMAPDAVAEIDKAAAAGAHGFKSLSGLPDFYRERLDGPHLRAVWSACERLHWPILIHIEGASDPHQQVEIERLLTDFPKVTVVLAHYGKMISHLDWCAQLLDRYPQCFMDMSMGTPIAWYLDTIDGNRDAVRDFVIKYQDRLMWGTDVIVTPAWTREKLRERIVNDLNLLSRDRFASHLSHHPRPLRGLNLPPEVLHKIWWVNPQRIYGITVREDQEARP